MRSKLMGGDLVATAWAARLFNDDAPHAPRGCAA